jgi:Ca2+-binding EF-hand superfamily protein
VNGDGTLSVAELQTVLGKLGLPSDMPMVQAMLDIADTSGDGFLDYDEFVAFISVVIKLGNDGVGW